MEKWVAGQAHRALPGVLFKNPVAVAWVIFEETIHLVPRGVWQTTNTSETLPETNMKLAPET